MIVFTIIGIVVAAWLLPALFGFITLVLHDRQNWVWYGILSLGWPYWWYKGVMYR